MRCWGYGRKITPNLREGTPNHLYLKGEHRGVWNEEALVASKEIILCESLLDAMTFWAAGFRNVTASYGVHGFTKDHWTAFAKHGVERVYLAYDADDAGNGAAAKLAGELLEGGIECFRVQFPKGMDANEYARKVQPANKSLGVLLRRAEWLGKGARGSVAVAEVVADAVQKQATKEETLDEELEPERCAALEQSIGLCCINRPEGLWTGTMISCSSVVVSRSRSSCSAFAGTASMGSATGT